MSAGTFAPAPGPARLDRMLLAQASMEVRLLLRNGEQLLLTIVIPALLLLLLSSLPIVATGGGRRVDFLAPGILALAVMSTAFTGQAIATGYERRYGVLKRVGATPLPRWGLVVAKSGAVLAIEGLQVALLAAIALGLGWTPKGSLPLAAAVFVLGTVSFSGLGLLMAGTLKAEATLAAANLVFVLLLIAGDIVIPLSVFPVELRGVLDGSPAAALAGGLRAVLQLGTAPPLRDLLVLAGWAVAATAVAGRTFRWE